MPIGKKDDGTSTAKKRSAAERRAPRPLGMDATVSPMVQMLDRELVKLKKSKMPREEAQTIVRRYFDMQRMRVAMTLAKKADEKLGRPTDIMTYLIDNMSILEQELSRLLEPYAAQHPVGAWMLGQKGIGGVIAAGLLAELDITKCPTAGHMLSYAGMIPGQRPVRGQRIEWNPQVKLLCFYAGESFAKQVNREDAYYGQCLKWAKLLEWKRNINGELAGEAARALEERSFDKDTSAYKWYSGQYATADFTGTYITGVPSKSTQTHVLRVSYYKGGHNKHGEVLSGLRVPIDGVPMLPPEHVSNRAKRRAVKMFIHHLHFIWYNEQYGRNPPMPYAIQWMGHADFYPPPNWTVRGVPIAEAPWLRRDVPSYPTAHDLDDARLLHEIDNSRKQDR